jgi:hypothetical protein
LLDKDTASPRMYLPYSLGGAAGSLIGYGYAKLGLEAESLLRSNIQERENDFVVKSVPS